MNFSPQKPHYSFVRQGFDLAIALHAFQTQDGKEGGPLPLSKCRQPIVRDQSSLSDRCSSAEPGPDRSQRIGCCLFFLSWPKGSTQWWAFILGIQLFRKGRNKAGRDDFFLEIMVRLSYRAVKFEFLQLHYMFQKLRTCLLV